jgi:hypothetical protein
MIHKKKFKNDSMIHQQKLRLREERERATEEEGSRHSADLALSTTALSSRRLGIGQVTRSPTHRWPGGDRGVVGTLGPEEAPRQPASREGIQEWPNHWRSGEGIRESGS